MMPYKKSTATHAARSTDRSNTAALRMQPLTISAMSLDVMNAADEVDGVLDETGGETAEPTRVVLIAKWGVSGRKAVAKKPAGRTRWSTLPYRRSRGACRARCSSSA